MQISPSWLVSNNLRHFYYMLEYICLEYSPLPQIKKGTNFRYAIGLYCLLFGNDLKDNQKIFCESRIYQNIVGIDLQFMKNYTDFLSFFKCKYTYIIFLLTLRFNVYKTLGYQTNLDQYWKNVTFLF